MHCYGFLASKLMLHYPIISDDLIEILQPTLAWQLGILQIEEKLPHTTHHKWDKIEEEVAWIEKAIPRQAIVAGLRLRRRWTPSWPSWRGRWCRRRSRRTWSPGSRRSTNPGCGRRSGITKLGVKDLLDSVDIKFSIKAGRIDHKSCLCPCSSNPVRVVPVDGGVVGVSRRLDQVRDLLQNFPDRNLHPILLEEREQILPDFPVKIFRLRGQICEPLLHWVVTPRISYRVNTAQFDFENHPTHLQTWRLCVERLNQDGE